MITGKRIICIHHIFLKSDQGIQGFKRRSGRIFSYIAGLRHKIDGKRVQLTDHSIFVAFAPVDNPKIAIAVFVENGYWGGRYAGRIASLMIEKYLKGTITRTDMEDWILSHSLEDEYAKPLSGEPFIINR